MNTQTIPTILDFSYQQARLANLTAALQTKTQYVQQQMETIFLNHGIKECFRQQF